MDIQDVYPSPNNLTFSNQELIRMYGYDRIR